MRLLLVASTLVAGICLRKPDCSAVRLEDPVNEYLGRPGLSSPIWLYLRGDELTGTATNSGETGCQVQQ